MVSEDPQPSASPNTPDSPDAGQDVTPARATRLTNIVVGHLADQARRTAQGAKARQVVSVDGQPGVADLTPLRELLSDLVEEAAEGEAAGANSPRAAAGSRHHQPAGPLRSGDQGPPGRRGGDPACRAAGYRRAVQRQKPDPILANCVPVVIRSCQARMLTARAVTHRAIPQTGASESDPVVMRTSAVANEAIISRP